MWCGYDCRYTRQQITRTGRFCPEGLENMKHRGAEGADNKTGDGAGIMVQIPHEFILLQGIPVPEKVNMAQDWYFFLKTAQNNSIF